MCMLEGNIFLLEMYLVINMINGHICNTMAASGKLIIKNNTSNNNNKKLSWNRLISVPLTKNVHESKSLHA